MKNFSFYYCDKILLILCHFLNNELPRARIRFKIQDFKSNSQVFTIYNNY